MTIFQFKRGDHVIANGYPGTITEVYIAPTDKEQGMYNIRLRAGEICLPGDTIYFNKSQTWRPDA